MPQNEWNHYERDSRIAIHGQFVTHPFETNIWQMGIEDQIAYLMSIASAGCNMGKRKPDNFVDWIYWKLGDKIADDYMIPYNQKMFGTELNQLGTYWMEKLPNVSFEDTLRSCLMHKAYGQQPGHAQFYYPKKYGFGELWTRMAEKLGTRIEYNKRVNSIDFNTHLVTTDDGSRYQADTIITTIPWMEYARIEGMPGEMKELISKLKYSSLQIKYYSENLDTKAQWIYYPDQDLSFHRILVRSNFCPDSNGYWTETNSDRIFMEEPDNNFKYMNKYAYPLNTITKPKVMECLLTWSEEHGVYGLGRWGEHQHYNADLTVELAMKLAEKLL